MVHGLRRLNYATHHFLLSYTPFFRDFLRSMRKFLSEFCMCPIRWPETLHVLQGMINPSSADVINGISTVMSFTGFPSNNLLQGIVLETSMEWKSLQDIPTRQILNVQRLRETNEKMQKLLNSAAFRKS